MAATVEAVPNTKTAEKETAISEADAARKLVRMGKEQGLSLTGPDGLLKQLTKTAIDEDMTEHLGYEKHGAPEGERMMACSQDSQDSQITLEGAERPAGDWTHFRVGQPVSVHSHGMETGTGVIDDMRADGSIIWVRFDGAPSRRMFLWGDPEAIRPLP